MKVEKLKLKKKKTTAVVTENLSTRESYKELFKINRTVTGIECYRIIIVPSSTQKLKYSQIPLLSKLSQNVQLIFEKLQQS